MQRSASMEQAVEGVRIFEQAHQLVSFFAPRRDGAIDATHAPVQRYDTADEQVAVARRRASCRGPGSAAEASCSVSMASIPEDSGGLAEMTGGTRRVRSSIDQMPTPDSPQGSREAATTTLAWMDAETQALTARHFGNTGENTSSPPAYSTPDRHRGGQRTTPHRLPARAPASDPRIPHPRTQDAVDGRGETVLSLPHAVR